MQGDDTNSESEGGSGKSSDSSMSHCSAPDAPMPEELTCADTLAVREERTADAQGKAQRAALEEKAATASEAVAGGEVAGGNHGGDSDDQLDPTQLAPDRTSQHPQLQEARAKEKGKEDEHKGQLGAGSGGRAKVWAGGAGIKVAMLPGCCC
jgi:hypothetical protein